MKLLLPFALLVPLLALTATGAQAEEWQYLGSCDNHRGLSFSLDSKNLPQLLQGRPFSQSISFVHHRRNYGEENEMESATFVLMATQKPQRPKDGHKLSVQFKVMDYDQEEYDSHSPKFSFNKYYLFENYDFPSEKTLAFDCTIRSR